MLWRPRGGMDAGRLDDSNELRLRPGLVVCMPAMLFGGVEFGRCSSDIGLDAISCLVEGIYGGREEIRARCKGVVRGCKGGGM